MNHHANKIYMLFQPSTNLEKLESFTQKFGHLGRVPNPIPTSDVLMWGRDQFVQNLNQIRFVGEIIHLPSGKLT